MSVLFVTHERYLDHDTGARHPERPSRLSAVLRGLVDHGLDEALVRCDAQPATVDELNRVHDSQLIDRLERFCQEGGGHIDPDTVACATSWAAAILAAGAGLTAIERLDAGDEDAAFCAVRPPGHHATATRSMGFCLLNNVAVSAATLALRGERVLIVDWDAHHGNGTQDVFYDDDRVLYVSLHQYGRTPSGSSYPGTGAVDETGSGPGAGFTVNVPFPVGTSGDVYREAVDRLVIPAASRFQPTWVLLSAGFDAHRDDPLCYLGLSAGDYYDLTARLVALVPAGKRMVFLEGGYDLDALSRSSAACVSALAGVELRPEPVTTGATGADVINAVARLHSLER